MSKIIINADDLGYSMAVNRAIEKAIKSSVITSTTVMANMSDQALQDAVRIQQENPSVSYGAHLNLTEGHPLLHNDYLLKIGFLKADSDGNISFNGLAFRKKHIGIKAQREIYKELDAQITKLESCGLKLSHIDSHHHIHTELFILPSVVKVAKKHGLFRIRIIRNLGISGVNGLYRKIWRVYLYCLSPRFVTTKVFGSFSDYLRNEEFFSNKEIVVELMCHPGGKEKYQKEEDLLYISSVYQRNKKISYCEI